MEKGDGKRAPGGSVICFFPTCRISGCSFPSKQSRYSGFRNKSRRILLYKRGDRCWPVTLSEAIGTPCTMATSVILLSFLPSLCFDKERRLDEKEFKLEKSTVT